MNSFEITTDANNLWYSGQKVKKSSPSKYQTQKFMRELLINIDKAIAELTDRTWVIEQMKPFIIYGLDHGAVVFINI